MSGSGLGSNPVSPATCPAATGTDAYLAKISAFTTGSTTAPTETVIYFSYLGGSGTDEGDAITVDPGTSVIGAGVYITGVTNSGDFPVLHAPAGRGSLAGDDAFVTRIDPAATTQTANTDFSFFLGGSGQDCGTGTVLMPPASYCGGIYRFRQFPHYIWRVSKHFERLFRCFCHQAGARYQFVDDGSVSPTTPIGVGGQVTFTYTITNSGDFVPGATVVLNMPDTDTASIVQIPARAAVQSLLRRLLVRWDRLLQLRQRLHPRRYMWF